MTTEAKKRKFHTAEFKAKVGLQALAAEKTINELAQQHHKFDTFLYKFRSPRGGLPMNSTTCVSFKLGKKIVCSGTFCSLE